MNHQVGAHGVGVEKEVGNAGQGVAKEKSATFYPHFPQACRWGSWIRSFANVMLQMDQAVERLDFMTEFVQPSKFELHHLMQKDVFQNHHHKVDKVEWETLLSGLER